MDCRTACVVREKCDRIKIVLKVNLHGSTTDFLNIANKAGYGNECDWLKSAS